MKLRMPMTPRAWTWVPARIGLLLLTVAGVAVDASHRRSRRDREEPEVAAAIRLLGTADMALSSASRWLRHPSLSEPGAAFADGPAILDADPAGAWIAPPVPVIAGTRIGAEQARSVP